MPRQAQNISNAATRVHARDHLEVDGSSHEAGKTEAPSFFGRSFDRYKERSKVINAEFDQTVFGNQTVFEKEVL